MDQVLRRLVDQGQQGLLLQPLPRTQGRRRPQRRQLLPEALLPRARHPQEEDVLIWNDDENKDWGSDADVTDDGQYLIITIGKGTDDKYRVLWRPLNDWDAEPTHLVDDFDADYTFIDNDGPIFFFRTDNDAPRGRVIAINVNHPEPENWKEIIPEADETLGSRRPRRRPASSPPT